MLKSKIWLEVIIPAEAELPAVPPSPVLAVIKTILLNLVPGKSRRALVVLLRRTEGGENQGVVRSEPLADIQHICK